MREIDEIRAKKSVLQDLRHQLVDQHRHREATEVTLKIEALLWVLGCDWNSRWYEEEPGNTPVKYS